MTMLKYIPIFFIITGGFYSYGQTNSSSENLGEMVNSEYEELSPVISGDETRLFFVRMNHPGNHYGKKRSQDIWLTEKDESGKWSEAACLPKTVNISRYNAVFWTNEDGTELIIKGIFNKKGTEWKDRGFSKISSKDNGKWGKPKPLKISGFKNKNDGILSSASFSSDEKTLLMSFSSITNGKKSDIYINTKKKNTYSRPKKIKAVSSKYDEQAPFLTSDGNSLFFSSNLSGNYNIYRSEKQGESLTDWSEPQPVNTGINTSGWDSYFRLTSDLGAAFFVSDHNTLGNADIFSLKIDSVAKEIKDDVEFISFKGVIKDQYNQKLPVINFRLIIDSVEVDYINQHPDSAAFEVSLPLKDNYHVTSLVPGYTIDTILLYTENKGLNLYDIVLTAESTTQTPVPASEASPVVFRIFGNILEHGTHSVLSGNALPNIEFDNAEVISREYNPATGSYSIDFSRGPNNPILNVSANGYRTFTQVIYPSVDVREIVKNVYLNRKSDAVVVTGKLINAKTNQPVDNIQGLSLAVNNTPFPDLVYIQEEKSYQIQLEKGKKYSIEPNLKGYFGVTETIDVTGSSQEKIERDLFLSPVEVGQSVKLEKIYFKTGSADLTDQSIPELKRISNFLRENLTMVIEIGGHTDDIGNDAYNLKLSEDRAKSVARYIILSGIPRERIEFKGYGESQPLVPNNSAEGREQNRRVEFKLLKN